MSLLSINTKQLDKLQLKEIKLQNTEPSLEPIKFKIVEKPSDYKRLLARNPFLAQLVNTFDLIIEK